MRKFFNSKGFTLIELLIVIAILGVLAAGILVAIDPVDKIRAANDAKVQTEVGILGRASEAYAVTHNGFYPAATSDLSDSGELKVVPTAPTGYDYTFTASPDSCVAGTSCESVVVTSTLLSKKYTSTPFQRYETSTAKVCQVATADTACP